LFQSILPKEVEHAVQHHFRPLPVPEFDQPMASC
jgi:hypothetical protein